MKLDALLDHGFPAPCPNTGHFDLKAIEACTVPTVAAVVLTGPSPALPTCAAAGSAAAVSCSCLQAIIFSTSRKMVVPFDWRSAVPLMRPWPSRKVVFPLVEELPTIWPRSL